MRGRLRESVSGRRQCNADIAMIANGHFRSLAAIPTFPPGEATRLPCPGRQSSMPRTGAVSTVTRPTAPSADRVRRAAISRSLLPNAAKTRQRRTVDMRTLLSGVAIAIVAALAITAPASAQRSGPGPTAQTTTGPGVIPPGGFGPSETSLYNVPYGSPGLPYSAFYGTTGVTMPPPGATAPAILPPSQ